MYFYLSESTPVIYIANIAEAVFDFVDRASNEQRYSQLIEEMKSLGDRALLYPVDAKLVFVSLPIPHAEYLIEKLGFRNTKYLYPKDSSPFLSLDIVNSIDLLEEIVNYVGVNRTLQLIPYATTRFFLQLVELLKVKYGLNVLLPESPTMKCLWLREFVDTKAGFRGLASYWLPKAQQILPQGIVCQDIEQAAQVAYWFTRQNCPCVVKANKGNDALGQTFVHPNQFASAEKILEFLKLDSFLKDDLLIVESYISSPQKLFPSIEFIVPPLDVAQPTATYVCNQLFLESGTFSGVLLSRELENSSWYSPLLNAGLLLARRLQEMGYVGHFDLDAIVDTDEQIFLIEINARRTGGTHIHELGYFLLGQNYLESVVVLSNVAENSGNITRFNDLLEIIENIVCPAQNQNLEIIVTHSSALAAHRFGYVIFAPSIQMALDLQQKLKQALLKACVIER